VTALGLLFTIPTCLASWTIDNGISTGSGTAITAYEPVASPVTGTYHATQSVTLTATDSSAICYTTDDTTPDCETATTCSNGTIYSSAISVESTDTIKAISCYDDNGYVSKSNVATYTYTLTCSTSSVSNGTVGSYPGCAITCNSGYTLNNNTCVVSAVTRNTGSGSSGISTIYCSTVEYSDWGVCIGNIQTRQIINRSPSSCTLTTSQQLATNRECVINNEEENTDEEQLDSDDQETRDNNQEEEVNNREIRNNRGIGILQKSQKEVLKREKEKQGTPNTALSNSLSGLILLQVEEKGEAWYVEPQNNERHFLGLPSDAFTMMRKFGLGISENNFNKFQEEGVPSNFFGRIFLRVESKGEAYYINPVDLKMHYLALPADAFRIMSELALGITNNDIRQIPLGLDEFNAISLVDIDLSIGMIEPEVFDLQRYLNTTNFPVALEGTGSKGLETNVFGSLTEEALKKFQAYNNLSETGIFDKETRDFLASY